MAYDWVAILFSVTLFWLARNGSTKARTLHEFSFFYFQYSIPPQPAKALAIIQIPFLNTWKFICREKRRHILKYNGRTLNHHSPNIRLVCGMCQFRYPISGGTDSWVVVWPSHLPVALYYCLLLSFSRRLILRGLLANLGNLKFKEKQRWEIRIEP